MTPSPGRLLTLVGLLRPTSKQLPGGNTTTYDFYRVAEMEANPCVAGSPGVNQAGRVKRTLSPDPDGAGPQTQVQQVYDATGRVVAQATFSGNGLGAAPAPSDWVC